MSRSITVSVDVSNPGQFFACCGLLELADRMQDEGVARPTGYFVNASFELRDVQHSVSTLIERLAKCQPSSDPSGDAGDSLASLELPCVRLRLDWWREPNGRKEPFRKTAFKLWAGQQTSRSIYATLRTAVATLLSNNRIADVAPFRARASLTGRFGFDPGAAWNALDAGFSPNEQGYSVSSSPVVELLAAIGLQRFRPAAVDGDRDAFEYVAWGVPLPVVVAAAAAAGVIHDPNARRFRFRVVSRGSYGSFTSATEIVRSP
jgi:hypothetical protein